MYYGIYMELQVCSKNTMVLCLKHGITIEPCLKKYTVTFESENFACLKKLTYFFSFLFFLFLEKSWNFIRIHLQHYQLITRVSAKR